MNEIDKLAQYFAKFPGIGTRQAKRFVYFVLSSNPQFAKDISAKILSLVENTAQCRECRRYFEYRNPDKITICDFCRDPSVDGSKIMIVEKDLDLLNMRKSNAYQGKFFILGSLIPLTEIKKDVSLPRVDELKNRIEQEASRSVLKEVVLALNATPEGDHTTLELKTMLMPFRDKYNLIITTLGRGLSTGSELEYSDTETIKNALENRKV